MRDAITVEIDGKAIDVPLHTSVASVILMARGFRRSNSGEPRTPLCGMGICFECRATVNGVSQQRTCQMFCKEGMKIRTDA